MQTMECTGKKNWQKISADEMKVRDIVNIFFYDTGVDEGYDDATVIQIVERGGERFAVMFRPYVHLGEYEFANGVIPYLGSERFEVRMTKERNILLKYRAKK